MSIEILKEKKVNDNYSIQEYKAYGYRGKKRYGSRYSYSRERYKKLMKECRRLSK